MNVYYFTAEWNNGSVSRFIVAANDAQQGGAIVQNEVEHAFPNRTHNPNITVVVMLPNASETATPELIESYL